MILNKKKLLHSFLLCNQKLRSDYISHLKQLQSDFLYQSSYLYYHLYEQITASQIVYFKGFTTKNRIVHCGRKSTQLLI